MPSTVYLVTGGTRSGKSSYAQKMCERMCDNPVYLATSKVWDDDFRGRIERHKRDRGDNWTTVEEPLKPSNRADQFEGRVVLVDCLTLWLTNYFVEEGAFNENEEEEEQAAMSTKKQETGGSDTAESADAPEDRALEQIKEEFELLTKPWNATFVFVTNELGSGTHASTRMSRKFVDAHGWLNQHVAARASCVVHMVCGMPHTLKDELTGQKGSDSSRCSNNNTGKLLEAKMLDRFLSGRALKMDEKGYFMMKVDSAKGVIVASFHSCILNDKGEVCDLQGKKIPCCADKNNRPEPMKTWECRTAKELTTEVFERWEYASQLVTIGHSAYVGREAQKAELCLYSGERYQQD